MPTQKVSVTLEVTSIERTRKIAGPRGLSAYLDAALAEKLERDERRAALLDALDELDELDPPTADERRAGRSRADRIRASVAR